MAIRMIVKASSVPEINEQAPEEQVEPKQLSLF